TAGVMNKPMLLFLICSICFTMFSVNAEAQSQAKDKSEHDIGPFLLVANQGSRSLSMIDPSTAKQVAVIAEEDITGHEVAPLRMGALRTCQFMEILEW